MSKKKWFPINNSRFEHRGESVNKSSFRAFHQMLPVFLVLRYVVYKVDSNVLGVLYRIRNFLPLNLRTTVYRFH